MTFSWKLEEGKWSDYHAQKDPYLGRIMFSLPSDRPNFPPLKAMPDPDYHIGVVVPDACVYGRIAWLTVCREECNRQDRHNCWGIEFSTPIETWTATPSLGISPLHAWIRDGRLIIDGGLEHLPENHGGETP